MKKIIVTAVVVLILAIALMFILNGSANSNVVKNEENNIKEFTLDATRFKYSPDTITVNKGDKVKISINNIDTTHGIRIPNFNVKDNEKVEFIADKQGEFDFYCTVYCGDKHKEMKGKLIVK
ncbi:cupredoxin domain-containing protein [Candidatus Pacearchaeota archaeon]|nr:cupredoxin domain-containing protein [Candidatus Pacearchaeota archaeon]